jgi:hypothetical protein
MGEPWRRGNKLSLRPWPRAPQLCVKGIVFSVSRKEAALLYHTAKRKYGSSCQHKIVNDHYETL